MDPRLIIRAIAVALLAGSAFACAIDVDRLGSDPEPSSTSINDTTDPLAAELARCNALGAGAANDAACQAAWAKNRQHFFATDSTQRQHQHDLFPTLPSDSPAKAPAKSELDRVPSATPPTAAPAPDATPQGR